MMRRHVYLKTYTYGMKKKSQLADKLEKFLSETQELRKYLIKEEREGKNLRI